MVNLTINTDGGSRGNPGPAACAFVVTKDNEIIERGSLYLGKKTNNEAEYYGVILALKWLEKQDFDKETTVNFILDSELVVKQLNGVYKTKDNRMATFVTYIYQHLKKLSIVFRFSSVKREKNKEADRLVNDCLDKLK